MIKNLETLECKVNKCVQIKKLKTCIVKQKPINTLRRQLTLEENICNIVLIPLIWENLLKMDGIKSNKQTKQSLIEKMGKRNDTKWI